MILYDHDIEPNMSDHGVSIPMAPSRRERIIDYVAQSGSKLPVIDFAGARGALGLGEVGALSRSDFARVHAPSYLERLYNETAPDSLDQEMLATYELVNPDGTFHRYDPSKAVKPLSNLFAITCRRAFGTYLCCRLALDKSPRGLRPPIPRFCFYLSGGNHHARYDRGSGFCSINDLVIACRKLQAEDNVGLIWIIDLDAHKGDGTAELIRFSRDRGETFVGKNPQVITLSAHMSHGWPLDEASLAVAEPGRAPLVPSDIDIPVNSGEEGIYVPLLKGAFSKLEAISGGRKPDLALVVAGMDVYEKDGLPSTAPLKMTLDQCIDRDRFVFDYLRAQSITSAWVLAGGYGEDAWEPTARFLAGL
jgi:acetoin utilization deacetylase AcuC-like enzyme